MTQGETSGAEAAVLMASAREAHAGGENGAALTAISQSLAQRDSADAWDLKGDILLALEHFPEAVAAYGQAVEREPTNPVYVHDLGRSLLRNRQPAEAEPVLARAVALKPGGWDALCDLGTSQLEQGRAAAAFSSFAEALAVQPYAAVAHFNLGNALQDLGRYKDAEACYREALRFTPAFLPALLSLATLLCEMGHVEEGRKLFADAKGLGAETPLLEQAYSLVDLRTGNLREGFAAYEARFYPSPHALPVRPFPAPRWEGESLAGRDILIWTEQGLGDEILSASMFPVVIAAARTCTIECSARVAPLFSRSFPDARVIERRDPPDKAVTGIFDFQSPAMSLARCLLSALDDFPRHAGYLRADEDLTGRLRQKYRAIAHANLVVGISWESTALHGARKRLPLDAWGPILNLPGVTFVSLQYGVKPGDPALAAAGERVIVDAEVDALKSLDASAAQVAAMDLVITVSNTTAHLAGAQHVPVWTLLPEGPGCFWYWFRNRSDSPWYPSMRMFRQPKPGDWPGAVNAVALALVEVKPQGRL